MRTCTLMLGKEGFHSLLLQGTKSGDQQHDRTPPEAHPPPSAADFVLLTPKTRDKIPRTDNLTFGVSPMLNLMLILYQKGGNGPDAHLGIHCSRKYGAGESSPCLSADGQGTSDYGA